MRSSGPMGAVLVGAAWLGLTGALMAAEYQDGDLVQVIRATDLKIQRVVVGRVARGEVLEVEKTDNAWLWVLKNGRRGWLHSKNVRRAALTLPVPEWEGGTHAPPPFGPEVVFDDDELPLDLDRPFEGRVGGRPTVIMAPQFFNLRGCGRWEGGIIVGGGARGPHGGAGSASCTVELPGGSSPRKMMIGIHHGMPGDEHGKGIHGKYGGTVTVYINNVAVHTFKCIYRHKYGDCWPDRFPDLGHDLPVIDLERKGIKGPKLTITLKTSPGTCMDLRSIHVSFTQAQAGISGLVVGPQQFTPKAGHSFSQDMAAMVLNGGPRGPNDKAGAASCKATIGEGVGRVTIFINHGSDYGQGIHSTMRGGTLKISVNGVPVHTFTCDNRAENLNDFYPERRPALSHRVPVDLRARGIKGPELTIKFEAAARTCMDIQSVRIAPELGGELDELPMPGLPVRDRFAPDDFPVLPPRDR